VIEKANEYMRYDPYENNIIDNVDPISLMSRTDGDTMYWHQALQTHDKDKFIEAAIQEIEAHDNNNHWEVIPIENVPSGTKILEYEAKKKIAVKRSL
jgi:hypothetical protein